jgi:hypothetical protein
MVKRVKNKVGLAVELRGVACRQGDARFVRQKSDIGSLGGELGLGQAKPN